MQTLALRACLTRLRCSLRPKYSTAADNPLFWELPLYLRRKIQLEEDKTNARVDVWWDLDSCPIPKGINVFLVPERITNAVRSVGIEGPVTINAMGNFEALSCVTHKGLTSTGVHVMEIPHGSNVVDFFMDHTICWYSEGPPLVHYFVITRNSDFGGALSLMMMTGYNILLASSASSDLRKYASVMWPWNGLVRGKDIAAKRFDHGPWWYFSRVVDDLYPKKRCAIPKVPVNGSISTIRDVTDPQPTPPLNADANLKETSSGITATDTLNSQQKPDTAGEGFFRKVWRGVLSGTIAERWFVP